MGLSIPGAVPEDLDREEIMGAEEVALTRPSEGREGRDILVPPMAGTELGMERVCSTGRRLTVQRRKEREPSAGSNIKMSWKSFCLRRCDGERGSRDGDDCVELGLEDGGETTVGGGSRRFGSAWALDWMKIKVSGAGGRLAGGWTVRKRTSGRRLVDSD